MDPISALSAAVVNTSADSIPGDVLAFQKKRIIDNLAVAAAGRHADGLAQVVSLFGGQASAKAAPLAGTDTRAPLLDAIYYNSIAARALDYCDVVGPGQHPSSTDVPAALAVGADAGASGRDVLAALAIGQDVALRLCAPLSGDAVFHGFDGNVLSYFSACAIAGRLIGLSPEQQQNAFGLVLNRVAGTFLSNKNGSLAVRFIQGFASRAGVECALLACAGVTGPGDALLGEAGFYDLYARTRQIDSAGILLQLGEDFRGGEAVTCFKLYPSCSVTLSLTDAALELCAQTDFTADDIESVNLTISPIQNALCGARFDPGPAPEAAAIFSVRYVAANALIRKGSRLEHFRRDAILAEPLVGLAQAIEIRVEDTGGFDSCEIEVRLKDRRTLSAKGVNGKGWPQNPLTDADFSRKAEQCFEFGRYEAPAARAAALRETVSAFDGLASVEGVMALIAP